MNTQISEAINEACDKLVKLTFNENLHENFLLKLTIGTTLIYGSKFVNEVCVADIETFFIPKSVEELPYFNAKVDVFIKEVLRNFSK